MRRNELRTGDCALFVEIRTIALDTLFLIARPHSATQTTRWHSKISHTIRTIFVWSFPQLLVVPMEHVSSSELCSRSGTEKHIWHLSLCRGVEGDFFLCLWYWQGPLECQAWLTSESSCVDCCINRLAPFVPFLVELQLVLEGTEPLCPLWGDCYGDFKRIWDLPSRTRCANFSRQGPKIQPAKEIKDWCWVDSLNSSIWQGKNNSAWVKGTD